MTRTLEIHSSVASGHWLLKTAYYFLMASACMVPSMDSHGLLNIKSIAFLFSGFAFIASLFFNPSASNRLQNAIALFSLALFAMLFWAFLGVSWQSYAIDQTKLVLITFWTIFFTAYLVLKGVLSGREMVRAIVFFSLAYALLKLMVGLILFFKAGQLLEMLEKAGIRFVTFSIGGGVMRLQTSCDLFAPYLLFFVLMSDRMDLGFSKRFRILFIIISWVSILLSFSRFFIGVALVSHFIYALSGDLFRFFRSVFGFLLAAFVVVGALGPSRVAIYLEKRFVSEAAVRSDEVRVTQTEALLDLFEESPYFGNGLGAYSSKVIRDNERRHSYEVQWVSFLMQIGIVGIFFVGLAFFGLSYGILSSPVDRSKIALLILFFVWVASGLTNPFMISLASGVIYALFWVGGRLLNKSI